MKKLLLIISFTLLFLHFVFQSAGPNMWTQSLSGSGPIWQSSIAINPANQQIMYAGSNTMGIWKSTNGGLNWVQSNSGITNLTVQDVAISKSNPNVLYCGTSNLGAGNGMYKSTDAGATWTLINTGITQTPIGIQAIAVSPTDHNTVYIGIWDGSTTVNASDGLYKTTNGGTSWSVANTGITVKNILTIAVNPLNPNTVYAGTSFLVNPQTGPSFVYKSYNAGASWTSFSTGLPTGTAEVNPVRDLSISLTDTNVVLAGLFHNTTNGGAYLTTNGGTSWSRRSTGIPAVVGVLIRSVLIRPGSTTEFYAGLDQATPATIGVFKTTNAGVSWSSFNSGAMVQTYTVRALNFRTTADSTLFAGVAGTTGQGVYEYSYGPLGINDPNEIPAEFRLLQNYPNPFNPVTKIDYRIPKASHVKINVYDAGGKIVKVLFDGHQTQLTNSIKFNAEGLSSGVYFYKMTAGDFTDTKKMLLIK